MKRAIALSLVVAPAVLSAQRPTSATYITDEEVKAVLATPYWLFVGTLAFVVDLISGRSLSHAASSGLDVAVLGFCVWWLVKLIMRYRQR